MFSVYSKNKGIDLTVPILLEGSVYTEVYLIVLKILIILHLKTDIIQRSYNPY